MIYNINNTKIIIFILLLMIISIIFILIINKNEEEEFTEFVDTLSIPEAQKKADLIDDSDVLITSDDKTLNEKYITGEKGVRGPEGPRGYPGKDGGECKCKLPLFKFIDNETGDILAKHPENNYPTSQEISDNNLTEIIIPIPSGKKGETGQRGPIGPHGFGYLQD
tara:strand:- start:6654 stop:7151 length:498 start_codon:yes stop_codon:yes gene_type:complete